MTAEIEIPEQGAEGPIVVMGGDTAEWSLYLKVGVPTFCYNFAAVDYTYIRAPQKLGPGRHTLRFEFEIQPEHRTDTGKPVIYGAGGMGRLAVDGKWVAEGRIPQTMAFDVGCDKGAPVTDEYEPLAAFTGKVVEVTVDLHPEAALEPARHTEDQVTQAMARQ
ncbi:hypothetical protein [Myxococcus xanthus]|uniref:hypothetical protein n=1 Tax=Myxococcus xanthus TaxID=34 RepID=UPI001CED3DD3|nr:hypothetical protein [Myxococcus xanthus]